MYASVLLHCASKVLQKKKSLTISLLYKKKILQFPDYTSFSIFAWFHVILDFYNYSRQDIYLVNVKIASVCLCDQNIHTKH